LLHSSHELGELSQCTKHDDSTIDIIPVLLLLLLLSCQSFYKSVVLVQGTLPVEYLSDSGPLSAHGIFANAHQILEQYNASTAFTYLLIKNLSITGCEMRMHQVTKCLT